MDWQPMDTAPKNAAGEFYGPIVLVYYDADCLPWPAYWGPGGPDNAGCWHVCDDAADNTELETEDILGWMPLPEAPDAAGLVRNEKGHVVERPERNEDRT